MSALVAMATLATIVLAMVALYVASEDEHGDW